MTISKLQGLMLAAGLAMQPLPGMTAAYSALCSGNNNCSVVLGSGKIAMPGLVIDKERVLSWSQGGSGSKTDVGMGVGGLVLFGLPGLIGFAAKKHDYIFYINYLDETGATQLATVGFKNNVPANQFMMEIMGMTGLSMGEVNKTLQAKIDDLKREADEKARLASLSCSSILKPYGCSYGKYLEANPAAKIWAAKYPQMVPAEKARLGALD